MTKRGWGVLGLVLLVLAALLAGCASGEAYRGASSAGTYRSELPPALRGTDPALRDWYSPNYFNPYEMP